MTALLRKLNLGSDLLGTISVWSIKGGVGKTTLCSLLQSIFINTYDVRAKINDFDPQQNSNTRLDDIMNRMNEMKLKIDKPEVLINDMPPSREVKTLEVVNDSDLVVIPTNLDLYSLRACILSVGLVEKKIPIIVVFNSVMLSDGGPTKSEIETMDLFKKSILSAERVGKISYLIVPRIPPSDILKPFKKTYVNFVDFEQHSVRMSMNKSSFKVIIDSLNSIVSIFLDGVRPNRDDVIKDVFPALDK